MITIPETVALSPVADEATYKTIWQSLDTADPLVRAFEAGLRTDRISWVFVAGYQSALRLAFDGLAEKEWWCFAASEDQSGELAGVTLANGVLSGTKTWVAASDNIDGAIVTVNKQCFSVRAGEPGCHIETYPPGNFLPDMSTGKLTLVEYAATEALELKMDFGLAEPTALVAASAGYLLRETFRLDASELRQQLHAAIPEIKDNLDLAELYRIYSLIADIGKQIGAAATERKDTPEATDWQQNGKLLSLYRRGLSARIEKL